MSPSLLSKAVAPGSVYAVVWRVIESGLLPNRVITGAIVSTPLKSISSKLRGINLKLPLAKNIGPWIKSIFIPALTTLFNPLKLALKSSTRNPVAGVEFLLYTENSPKSLAGPSGLVLITCIESKRINTPSYGRAYATRLLMNESAGRFISIAGNEAPRPNKLYAML